MKKIKFIIRLSLPFIAVIISNLVYYLVKDNGKQKGYKKPFKRQVLKAE